MLGAIAAGLVFVAGVLSWTFRRAAPAASLALLGGIAGGPVGFLLGASNGPRYAPAAAAVGASVGLVALGILGLIITSSRSDGARRRRSAFCLVSGGLVSALLLAVLLLMACPLYVTHAGYCSYGGVDVLGGWVSGVVVLYVFDLLALAGFILMSSEWPGETPPESERK
jgi:hypothetical protein